MEEDPKPDNEFEPMDSWDTCLGGTCMSMREISKMMSTGGLGEVKNP